MKTKIYQRSTPNEVPLQNSKELFVHRLVLNFLVLLFFIPICALSQNKPTPKSFSLQSISQDQVELITLTKVNVDSLLSDDQKRSKEGRDPGPWRFAVGENVSLNTNNSGNWEQSPDGRLWRLRIHSPGAFSQNLGISRFNIPEGAMLWIYDNPRELVQGPFTSEDRNNRGGLYTPIVVGDEIIIELFVPNGAPDPEFNIQTVNRGYRSFSDKGSDKDHGPCNNDVICPEGNPWRDQIRSVARYTINGTSLCTGQLVNNTSIDFTPYFLSANHCGVSSSNDHTLVFYWNYESPVCGDLGGGSLTDNQSGSLYRASYAPSDFLLVELDDDPDPASNVFFSGWDISGTAAASSVAIHHPSGDVKSISFNTNAVTSTNYLSSSVTASGTHWRVDDWEDGTTEGGSSGSGLWDESTGRLIGQLHGGYASCTAVVDDWYGKLSLSWTGGSTNSTRLSNWLDPGATGVVAIDGDPHITTLNGVHYDFQGAGEYVVLRDPNVGEIQVRQAPIATTFNPGPNPYHGLATCVSINTAVAVRMGDNRITYQPNLTGVPDPSGLQLRINGELSTLGANGTYLGGGRISRTDADGGIEIVFPDRYVLTVTPRWWASQSKWLLNVRVVRTPTSSGVGGLSNGDDSFVGGIGGIIPPKHWLPRLPDGTPMGPMPSSLEDRYNDLYKKFGDAWRVTDATSLFDYAPGTSTANFTLADWPMKDPPCIVPQQAQVTPLGLAAAQEACADINDDNRRANCVFDVRVTGEIAFADLYRASQRLEDEGTFTQIRSESNPSYLGSEAKFIASVIRSKQGTSGTPTGSVQFLVDGVNMGSPISVDSNGQAIFTTSDLDEGKHTIAALYTPSTGSSFLASGSSELVQTVGSEDGTGVEGNIFVDYWWLWLILLIIILLIIRRLRRRP